MKNRVELEKNGWVRRGIFTEPRQSELAAVYRELGYEVLIKSLDATEVADAPCQKCLWLGNIKVLYTRGDASCRSISTTK